MRTLRQRMARDQAILLAALAAVAAAGWLVLARMDAGLAGAGARATTAMAMSGMSASSAGYGLTLAMWVAMTAAMMVPAAEPGTAAYLALARRVHPDQNLLAATAGFLGGTLGSWLGYAALGAAVQLALARAMLLTPLGAIASGHLAAGVLVVAGAYQLTPLKRACITHCRNPLLQLISTWRDGWIGALRLGWAHGSWCVACCWALMALMLVAGVMNLAWMAAVAALVLAEKLVPESWHFDLASGVVLICAGTWMALLAAS